MGANEFVTKYMGKFGNKLPNLVKVRFESYRSPGTYDGGSYTYIAEQPFAVGDIVNVPTMYGERTAMIVRTDVPIADIECKIGQLRKITGLAACPGDPFTGFFD